MSLVFNSSPRSERIAGVYADCWRAQIAGLSGKNRSKYLTGLCTPNIAAAAFTTFYNPLRWLDTLPLVELYSPVLVKMSEQSSEAGNAQEVAIDGPHANAPNAGAGHRAPGRGLDGLYYVAPEACATLRGPRGGHPARVFRRAEDRGKE